MGGTNGATGLGLRYLGFDEGARDWAEIVRATIQIDQPESSPYCFLGLRCLLKHDFRCLEYSGDSITIRQLQFIDGLPSNG